MASLPMKSAPNSGIVKQLKLLIVLKDQLDLVFRQLNHYRGTCKSVDRLYRAVRSVPIVQDNCTADGQLLAEFVKFERNYRVSRKKLRKLERKLLNGNPYDKLHDLYESLVMGESIAVDSVDIMNTPVPNFADIKIDPENCIEIQLDTRELESLNFFTSVDPSSFEKTMSDVGDGTGPVASQQFQCSQCDKSFKLLSGLSHHKRIHDSEPRYKCSWQGCDYSANYQICLKNHELTHTGERPYQCDKCHKSYTSSSSLIMHKRTHESEPRYKCSWVGCEYSAHRLQYLKAHQKVHTGEPPLECNWEGCDYTTHNSNSLRFHQTVHTGERPFQCSKCDQSFKSPSHLSHHKRTHESEPRYKCSWPECDYRTHRSDNFKIHQKVHTKERPHKCSRQGCDFSTHYSTLLMKHELNHTAANDGPSSLKDSEHIKIDPESESNCTEEIPPDTSHLAMFSGDSSSVARFQCSQCDKSFKTQNGFSRHKLIHGGCQS